MTPSRSYIICTSPRSGSTLLGQGLLYTKVAGNPQEWFSPLASRDDPWTRNMRDLDKFMEFQLRLHAAPTHTEYVNRVLTLGTSHNGVFGLKLHLAQIPEAKRRLRGHLSDSATPLHQLLSRTFPNLSYIWLRRRDKVSQAISLLKAIQTGEWGKTKGETSSAADNAMQRQPKFDSRTLYRYTDIFLGEDRAWKEIFAKCKIDPFVVFYEDFTRTYRHTIESILKYLNVQEPVAEIPEPRLAKQSDGTSAEWYRRFVAEHPHLEPDPEEDLDLWVNGLLE